MKQLRSWVPVLGILALIALFLKMPETPNVFGIFKCKTCVEGNPYLPLIGSGYFAILIAISMLFPSFPNSLVARGGLVWAVMLALALTYIDLPGWCVACLIGHVCHILIWTLWCIVPSPINDLKASPARERLFLVFLTPIIVIALFSSLNLTFMIYNLKAKNNILATGLNVGDAVGPFSIQTHENLSLANADIASMTGIVFNFVSPDCTFCKEQLPILDEVASQLANGSYRFINITPLLPLELIQQSPSTEWFEDKEGKLRELFKVSGYPTLFVIGPDGKIIHVIPGVPKDLKGYLLASLVSQ